MNLTYNKTSLQEKAIHTMLGTICVLAIIYVVILLSLIFSVIERKQNVISIRDLTSQLSELEASYANKVSSITETDLKDHQFIRIEGATFAVRKDDIASYTVLYAR